MGRLPRAETLSREAEGKNMIRARLTVVMLSWAALAAPAIVAQEVRTFENNGIRYQETTQVIQRLIPETRYEQRETTVHRERFTTEMQPSVRTYQVPVTEQQWVPGYQRTWNILKPPVLSYRLMPVTRWETRSETVNVPITKREYIPERQVTQVPITNTRLAEERIVRQVPLGAVNNGTPIVANREETSGGTGLDGDPPSESAFGGQIDRRK
jgi:hypothetical protein